jgi:DNA replication and repair protein RecF
MRVERLQLTSFRSYQSLDVSFPGGPQVVVGPNATGKTNLLESLVVLGTSRSHRTSGDGELVSWTADFARLEAGLEADNKVEVVISRSGVGGGRKRVLVNGVARRPSALAAALPVVLFAPEDMLLVIGSPSGRRNSLDTLIVQTVPTSAATMSTYGRALTQRNNLLRAIRENAAAPDELHYWDDVILENGAQIVDWRRTALGQLAGPLADAHQEIAPGEEGLNMEYLTNAEPLEGGTERH